MIILKTAPALVIIWREGRCTCGRACGEQPERGAQEGAEVRVGESVVQEAGGGGEGSERALDIACPGWLRASATAGRRSLPPPRPACRWCGRRRSREARGPSRPSQPLFYGPRRSATLAPWFWVTANSDPILGRVEFICCRATTTHKRRLANGPVRFESAEIVSLRPPDVGPPAI